MRAKHGLGDHEGQISDEVGKPAGVAGQAGWGNECEPRFHCACPPPGVARGESRVPCPPLLYFHLCFLKGQLLWHTPEMAHPLRSKVTFQTFLVLGLPLDLFTPEAHFMTSSSESSVFGKTKRCCLEMDLLYKVHEYFKSENKSFSWRSRHQTLSVLRHHLNNNNRTTKTASLHTIRYEPGNVQSILYPLFQ